MTRGVASLHNLAITKISNRRPEVLHTKGLWQFVRELDEKYEFCLVPEDRMSRIPDAWSYEPYENDDLPGVINLYEVEDSHLLSVDKLREYADFFFMCDFYDLDVRLFVYDRYGENEREIFLGEYFIMFLMEDHSPADRVRA